MSFGIPVIFTLFSVFKGFYSTVMDIERYQMPQLSYKFFIYEDNNA